MTKEAFIQLCKTNVELSKNAYSLFEKAKLILKNYEGKKMGTKTLARLMEDGKKEKLLIAVGNSNIQIIDSTNQVFGSFKFYPTKSGFMENNILNCELLDSFELRNKWVKLINVDIEAYVNELEQNYLKLRNLDDQIEITIKELGTILYNPFSNNNHYYYDFNYFLEQVAINNRL